MKNVCAFFLAVGCALSLSASVWAEESQKRRWDDVKVSLKRGAYRDALHSLNLILATTPNDPWAQLYHSLCELRLSSPQPFTEITPAQLATLKEQLRREEQAQRRASAQQKVLEREVRKEQAKWDRALEVLQRQAERDQKLRAQRAKVEALERARVERTKARELAQQQTPVKAGTNPAVTPATPATAQPQTAPPPAGAPETQEAQKEKPVTPIPLAPSVPSPPVTEIPLAQVSPPPSPAPLAERQPFEVTPSPQGQIELPKVVVPTVAPRAGEEAVAPSLRHRPRPPHGAVQINARQMSFSPERHLAIAQGDAEVVFENAILTADRLTLFTDTNDVYAEGRVRLEQGNEVFRGEMVQYNFNTKKGRFLQGTVFSPPWHEYGRSVEHIAEGVYEVTPGYLTSCELEPPHFRFYGRRATVFAEEKYARMRNVALFVEQVPFLYLPWLSVAEDQSPFFLVPGKHKPWGQFALSGYRYELPGLPGGGTQRGTLKMDWRRYFLWGFGADHKIDSPVWGKGLLKVYYNEEQNIKEPKSALPKGAAQKRYRVLWRHIIRPLPDTTIITDIQKYSDKNFRKDLLFREEYTSDDAPISYISLVKNAPNFTLTGLLRKRANPFQSVDNAMPQLTLDVRPQRIGKTNLFSQTSLDVADFQTKPANMHNNAKVFRLDWFQQLSYALSLFRPIEVTPRVGVRQTYYNRQKVGLDHPLVHDVVSGQFSSGVDASLKLFRIFSVTTNALGLNLHELRHVVTPTVGWSYTHPSTVSSQVLDFAATGGTSNQMTLGVENKLQTRRPALPSGKLRSVDLGRLLISLPYTYRGNGNKQGGRWGNWSLDLETYPWPWLRLESDWTYQSHLAAGALQNDARVPVWNVDLVMVGGRGEPRAEYAPGIQSQGFRAFQAGPRGGIELMPQGQWYLGYGHRYSQNDKTEDVLEYDWRLSPKWQVSTFFRFTWKEVVGGTKRFNNLRETQYILRRDLHDWIGELVYHVDREFGEEIYFTLTLKAYPAIPIRTATSYHEPKIGSQSSPFSPIRVQTP